MYNNAYYLAEFSFAYITPNFIDDKKNDELLMSIIS